MQVREGSIVSVWDRGVREYVRGVVWGVHGDVKNGISGIDYKDEATGFDRWAYADQIDAVIKY